MKIIANTKVFEGSKLLLEEDEEISELQYMRLTHEKWVGDSRRWKNGKMIKLTNTCGQMKYIRTFTFKD